MTTNQRTLPALRPKLTWRGVKTAGLAIVQAAAVFALARQAGLWPLAVVVVVAVELGFLSPLLGVSVKERGRGWLERVPALLIGLSVVLVVAVLPRALAQAGVVGLYGLWRVWWATKHAGAPASLLNLLFVQGAVFEALFLMAAVWRTPNWVVIGLAWGAAYVSVYAVLAQRGERAAGVLAATWALAVAEIAWVLLQWLFTYTLSGGYLLVPQPALVLTALAYCFGSIYVAQRQGKLSRGRLTEYLLIGLILIAIVVMGTPWRGSL